MTDRRGPQRSEDRSDLTPDAASHAAPYGVSEARAEVEAFMGDEYDVETDTNLSGFTVRAFGEGVRLWGEGPTYRAAVDALKAAWRDAVRPVAERGVVFGLADLHHSADPAVVRQEYAKRIPFLTSLSLGEEA